MPHPLRLCMLKSIFLQAKIEAAKFKKIVDHKIDILFTVAVMKMKLIAQLDGLRIPNQMIVKKKNRFEVATA